MIVACLLLAAFLAVMIEFTVIQPFFGGTLHVIRRRRDWLAQRDLPRVAPVPRLQLHFRTGWWYVEYLDDGLASGLATYEYVKNHAACFKNARPRCHPAASWWRQPRKEIA